MDELSSINVPWNQEFSGVLNFGFNPPASCSQSYSYSSLKTFHPYSTDDKTSGLMVKRFSTVRDTQKGSRSYTEKRRENRDIEVTRKIRGNQKGREQSSQ